MPSRKSVHGETTENAAPWHDIALALGANLDSPDAMIARAVDLLAANGVADIHVAPTILSEPVDCVPGTPVFHNTALVGRFRGSPQELLALTQGIEQTLGRPRNHSSREARVIDIDILLYDDIALETPTLTIPHPRMYQRPFVMTPLESLPEYWARFARP